MNDYSETDKKIFEWYEISMDILCMSFSNIKETSQMKKLIEIYEELLEKVKMLCKKSRLYRYIDEPFLRTWYFNKNKRRLNEKTYESPLVHGFQFMEKAGYFFNKWIDM